MEAGVKLEPDDKKKTQKKKEEEKPKPSSNMEVIIQDRLVYTLT
jgi:hypothetical protein